MVRQVIHAQSTKGHIQPGNEAKWSNKSFMLNEKKGHIQAGIAQRRGNGHWSDRSFMLNQQKVTYTLEMHKQVEMVRQVIHAQSKKVTYKLEMHKQGKMVRQVIHAQSTKGHIHPGSAQTR